MSSTPNQQQRYGCYIGNIDRSVHLEMLKQLFSQCGTILDCSLNGRDEDPYRYGFIDFATEEDRARAMRFNGFVLNERRLKVNVSRGNVNRPDGTPGKRPHNTMNDRNANPMGQDSAQMNPMQQVGGNTPPPNMSNGISPSQVDMLLQMLQNASPSQGLPPQQQQQPPPPQAPPQVPPPQQGGLSNLPYGGMGGMGGASGPMSTGAAGVAGGAGMPPPAPAMGGYPPMGPAMLPPGMPLLPGMPGMMPPGGWGMPPGAMGMPQPPGMMPPMGYPPMGPMGGMPGMGGHRGMGFGRGPANPPPTPEVLKQREKQRAEFYDVIRKDAERYEKKMTERRHKDKEKGDGAAGGKSSDDDESSDDERETKKAKKETTVE